MILPSPLCGPMQLDSISTKLENCLDIGSSMLWVFVYLIMWQRLFSSHEFVYQFKFWIVSFGVWFVVSFCMVLEFRNDRNLLTRTIFFLPQMKESSLTKLLAVKGRKKAPHQDYPGTCKAAALFRAGPDWGYILLTLKHLENLKTADVHQETKIGQRPVLEGFGTL